MKKHGHKVDGRLYTLSFDHIGVKMSMIAVSCTVIFVCCDVTMAFASRHDILPLRDQFSVCHKN